MNVAAGKIKNRKLFTTSASAIHANSKVS